jgi:hypothetical protein
MGLFDDDEDGPQKGLMGNGVATAVQSAQVLIKAPVGTTLESIPAPRPPESEGELTASERAAFEACKAGMNNLQNAFWVAGKSLETMKVGSLHRTEGVANFADFVWATWEVSEAQAHRLMDEWRIGEALALMGWKPRESQVRELTDLRNQSGDQAAVAVYDTVARSGQRVTAKLLSEVVRELPPLPAQAETADVRQRVQEVLASRAQSDPAQQNPSESGDGKPVPDITSFGKGSSGESSPIGESHPQDSSPKKSGGPGDDIRRLAAALTDLRAVGRRLTKPAVKRAMEHDPEGTSALLKEFDEVLNGIGRTVAVRRTDS